MVRHTSPEWSPNRSLYPLAKTAAARMASARLRTQGTRRVLNQIHQTPPNPTSRGGICQNFHGQ